MSIQKWRCGACGTHIHRTEELKSAPHPFQAGEILYGCPDCGSIEDLHAACDEDGCWRSVSCGTNTPKGYRNTCYEHRPVK